MDTESQHIRPLTPEVQSQIKSSVAVTSLSDVVIELIKNSLDAQAQAVSVEVDYVRGGCSVEDDGDGIPAHELSEHGHLGSMYCTSKHNAPMDTYGGHGCAIPSLAALSLLSITSRHRAEADECTVSFHETQVIARHRTIQEHQRLLHQLHGTKVTVRDLFRKLPVRAKHRALQYELQENLAKEFEDLKRKIVSLLLAWSRPVKVVLSDSEKRRRCVLNLKHEPSSCEGNAKGNAQLPLQPNWICTLLVQAGYIVKQPFARWVTASAQTSTTCIQAAISLEPAPTKQVQFVSFGIRPIDPVHLRHILFDEVNCMFAHSSFGAIDDEIGISAEEEPRQQPEKGYRNENPTARKCRAVPKGTDRWPMFYIRIDSSSEYGLPKDDQTHHSESEVVGILGKVLELLRILINQFLEEHRFRPHTRRQKRKGRTDAVSHMADSWGSPLAHSVLDETALKSTHTIKLATGTTAQHRTSDWRQHAAGRGFETWSRVKSGKQGELGYIATGLSQRKSLPSDLSRRIVPAACIHSPQSEFDARTMPLSEEQAQNPCSCGLPLFCEDLLNKDMVSYSDDEAGSENIRHPIFSPSDALITKDENALQRCNVSADGRTRCRNSTTRRVVRIDSRTGLTAPDLQDHRDDSHESEERSANLYGQPTSSSMENHGSTIQTSCASMESNQRLPEKLRTERLSGGSENSKLRQLGTAVPSVAPDEWLSYAEVASCCLGCSRAASSDEVPDLLPNLTRLSKRGLEEAQVLAQVDRKFILAKIMTSQTRSQPDGSNGMQLTGETVLVLIDQHAADERCQAEVLYGQLSNVQTVQLPEPLCFEVSAREAQLFEFHKDFFAAWGFRYETRTGHALHPQIALSGSQIRTTIGRTKDRPTVIVTALPELVAERCRLEPKTLVDLLRSEVWARSESETAEKRARVPPEKSLATKSDLQRSSGDESHWLAKITKCPKGLIDVLNSRACRSAVMFNDILCLEECNALVKRLAKCRFPFQCAHGRPSMVVLGRLGVEGGANLWCSQPDVVQEEAKSRGDFARAFANWQACT